MLKLPIPPWIKFIPIVVLLSISGYLYYNNNTLQDQLITTSEELVIEQNRNTLLDTSLKDALKTASRQAESLQNLSTQARVTVEENNRLNKILEGYKGHEEIAIDNPQDIERRANNAISSLLRQFECETGNVQSCTE